MIIKIEKLAKKSLVYQNGFIDNILSNLRSVGKGTSFIDADDQVKEISDSKDVTKRRKDLRNSIKQILESQNKDATQRLNKFGVNNKDQLSFIDINFIKYFIPIFSKMIGEFTEAITGSNRYKRDVSLFVSVLLNETLLNYMEDKEFEIDSELETDKAPEKTSPKSPTSSKKQKDEK